MARIRGHISSGRSLSAQNFMSFRSFGVARMGKMHQIKIGFYNSKNFSKLTFSIMYVGFLLIFLSAICKLLNNTAVSIYFTMGLAHHIYLSIGLTLMSLFYVLTALPANLDESTKANYMFKVFCLSMSLLLTGLVFKWNLWPFGDGILINSFFSLFIYYVIKHFICIFYNIIG